MSIWRGKRSSLASSAGRSPDGLASAISGANGAILVPILVPIVLFLPPVVLF